MTDIGGVVRSLPSTTSLSSPLSIATTTTSARNPHSRPRCLSPWPTILSLRAPLLRKGSARGVPGTPAVAEARLFGATPSVTPAHSSPTVEALRIRRLSSLVCKSCVQGHYPIKTCLRRTIALPHDRVALPSVLSPVRVSRIRSVRHIICRRIIARRRTHAQAQGAVLFNRCFHSSCLGFFSTATLLVLAPCLACIPPTFPYSASQTTSMRKHKRPMLQVPPICPICFSNLLRSSAPRDAGCPGQPHSRGSIQAECRSSGPRWPR